MTENSFHFLIILAHHVQGSSSLPVETHVLGVGLADQHIEPGVREQSHALGINVDVTACESLVSHVEEGKQVALLDLVHNNFPLI